MTSTEREPYARVNGAWPDGDLPVPTEQEAISGAKRLYRMAMGKPWKGKWAATSGRRHTWPRSGVFYVNANGNHFGGWRDIVHFMSHYCNYRLYPKHKPHHGSHHFLEKEMVEYVIRQGWLDGKLKRPEKPKPAFDPKRVRYERVCRRIEMWERKARRARTALKKLARTKGYYEKTLAQ